MAAHTAPRACLFIGPSLPASEVRAFCERLGIDVAVHGPAERGDVLRLLGSPPQVIALLDGRFFDVPSVLHREILLALERDVEVLGAASLGALRAAELHPFGMQGIGRIYRWYRDGQIDGDDEVAVAHAGSEQEFAPLTVPLVNVRYNLGRARRFGVIRPTTAALALSAARTVHFSQRTYAGLLETLNGSVCASERTALREFLADHAVDLKRMDALELLHTVARRLGGAERSPRPTHVELQWTTHFERSHREAIGYWATGQYVPQAFVLAVQRLEPSYLSLHRRVALRCVAADEALARGLEPERDAALIEQFRRDRGLVDEGTFQRWVARRYLIASELLDALRQRSLETRLREAYGLAAPTRIVAEVATRTGMPPSDVLRQVRMQPGVAWERAFVRELKLRGSFGTALRRARRILDLPVPDAIDRRSVEAWCAARWRVDVQSLPAAARARGYTSYSQFLEVAARVRAYGLLSLGSSVCSASSADSPSPSPGLI